MLLMAQVFNGFDAQSKAQTPNCVLMDWPGSQGREIESAQEGGNLTR